MDKFRDNKCSQEAFPKITNDVLSKTKAQEMNVQKCTIVISQEIILFIHTASAHREAEAQLKLSWEHSHSTSEPYPHPLRWNKMDEYRGYLHYAHMFCRFFEIYYGPPNTAGHEHRKAGCHTDLEHTQEHIKFVIFFLKWINDWEVWGIKRGICLIHTLHSNYFYINDYFDTLNPRYKCR